MLCQPVHPESNISYFPQFFVLDNALLFFIKTHRRRENLENNLTLSWRRPLSYRNANQWTGFYMITAFVMKGLKEYLENNFCSFPRAFYSRSSQFGKFTCSRFWSRFNKSIFTRFWGVLCQPVHPESNISHFRPFSVLDSALWIFFKTRFRVKKE